MHTVPSAPRRGLIRKAALFTLIAASLVIPSAVFASPANNPDFNFSRTFEFDPDNTGCVEAQWAKGEGRADSKGQNFGLVLEKNCDTIVVASAGAVGNSIKGTSATTLGFDIRDDSPCTGGSPRFNLQTEQGTFHFIGGCGNDGEKTSLGDGWSRVRFELSDPTEAFPPVPPGSTIAQVVLIADEEGQYHLDNIAVDELCAGKPGQSSACGS